MIDWGRVVGTLLKHYNSKQIAEEILPKAGVTVTPTHIQNLHKRFTKKPMYDLGRALERMLEAADPDAHERLIVKSREDYNVYMADQTTVKEFRRKRRS